MKLIDQLADDVFLVQVGDMDFLAVRLALDRVEVLGSFHYPHVASSVCRATDKDSLNSPQAP
jgi:hypothetical protein